MLILAAYLISGALAGGVIGNIASNSEAKAATAHVSSFKGCGWVRWSWIDPEMGYTWTEYPSRATRNMNCRSAKRLLAWSVSYLTHHHRKKVRHFGYLCRRGGGWSSNASLVYMRCSRGHKVADLVVPNE